MSVLRCGTWRLTLRPGMALLALAGAAAMVSLGNWQTRRAEEKLALQQRVDAHAQGPVLSLPAARVSAADYVNNRVAVRGEFAPRHMVFVDNRVLRGVPGYHVVTPLRIRGGDRYVLVNRGWITAGPTRDRLPEILTPAGDVVVEGLAVVPPERVYELAEETGPGPRVQHLVLARMAKRTGLELQPIVVQQTSDAPDGLVRAWERPDSGANTHRAYAVQWYAMGVVVIAIYFGLNLKRGNDDA